MIILFSPETLFSMEKLFLSNHPENNLIHDGHVINLIKELLAADKSFFHNNIVCGYLNIIMPSILKHIKLLPFIDVDSSSISTIIRYCSNHYKENLSLDIISENIHLNKYYISKIMNKTLNISFTQYINNLRIMNACDLLKSTDNNISYIAEEVGFGTIRSFNRAFYMIMGDTPTNYRNNILKRIKH